MNEELLEHRKRLLFDTAPGEFVVAAGTLRQHLAVAFAEAGGAAAASSSSCSAS